jgi:hypothetical protein
VLRQTLFACVVVLLIAASSAARADAPNNSAILVVGPNIQLSARTAAGDAMTRPDWSRAAQDNVRDCLEAHLRAANRPFQFETTSALLQGRSSQVLRLHAVVADAALNANRQRRAPSPGRRWTVGQGARDLAADYHAEYALIVAGDGVYASTSHDVLTLASNLRTAAAAATGNAAAAAALGFHALRPRAGGPRILASLVDLQSGDIIWIRQMDDAGNDPRTPEGARRLIRALFRNSPL